MRVAGYQMRVTRDIAANTAAILAAIERASAAGAEVLLTPEGSLSGYTPEFEADEVRQALVAVTAGARSHRLGLALGTCFLEDDGRCYNQVRFYERDGVYRGFHSKTLTCGSLTDPPRGEIEHYAVAPLTTYAIERVTVGALICNDLWANPGCTPGDDPHLTQRLANAGARLIFHSVNGGRDGSEWSQVAWHYHESNLRMRSRAAGVWLVTADSCEPTHLPCSAPSGVVDPEGNWACRTAEKGEELFVHDIPLGAADD